MKPVMAFVAMLIFCQVAAAQTTQPADHGWPKAVNVIAQTLVDGDVAGLTQMLTPHTAIRPFDAKKDDADLAHLLDRTTRGTPLGAHAYIHPPLAMAADIAADFKTATIVTDDVRRKMVPGDEEAMRRANATAVQWIEQSLDAKEHDFVAVFVFWIPRTATPEAETDPANPPAMSAMFVLIRASEATPGDFKIDRIVYGHPLPGN